MGLTHDLVLTDVADESLNEFASELICDGYTIAGVHPGDLGDAALLGRIVADLADGYPFAVVHTAGISPAMAGWRPIIEVNLVTTEKLLRAVEPHLLPGSVAVLIASVAGHARIGIPDARAIVAGPMAEDFVDRIGVAIRETTDANGGSESVLAYILSKLGVLVAGELRAHAWGARGARIVSISPGMILTPMGRAELEATPGSRELGEAAPAGRLGNALDIAKAARFLISDEASFITGCDLRVDGGSVGSRR